MNYKNKKSHKNSKPTRAPKEQSRKYQDPTSLDADKYNDASWYTRNNDLARGAGNLSFNDPLGKPLKIGKDSNYQSPRQNEAVPGIAKIEFVPTIGKCESKYDPFNVAANNIYSFVRHVNSGHANYDATNLGMYIAACDSAYMFYELGCRLYGVLNVFSQRNRYLPQALTAAMGFNWDEWNDKLADFRYYLNSYSVRLSTLMIPDSFTYNNRHAYLCRNIFADGDDLKSQIYFYMPTYLYKYWGPQDTDPAFLQLARIPNTYDDFKAFGRDLLNSILAVEDFQIMSGDLLKAYDPGKMIKVNSIPENYVVLPTYDTINLQQIRNTTLVGNIFAVDCKITEELIDTDMPYLKQALPVENDAVAKSWIGDQSERLIAADSANPTPDEVLDITRNVIFLDESNAAPFATPSNFTSEVFTFMRIYTFIDRGNTIGTETVALKTVMQFDETDTNEWIVWAKKMSKLGFFDYHPCILLQTTTEVAGVDLPVPNGFIPFWDINNYTSINSTTASKLNETAMLSMLNVPQLGMQG